MTLPQMLDGGGEVVRVVEARDLLKAAGIADVSAAETIDLATFTGNADHLTQIAREAKGTVSDELVRRLDRRGKWTERVGGYTIKAPSPAAGTDKYDDEKLAAAIEWYSPPAPAPYWKQSAAVAASWSITSAVTRTASAGRDQGAGEARRRGR